MTKYCGHGIKICCLTFCLKVEKSGIVFCCYNCLDLPWEKFFQVCYLFSQFLRAGILCWEKVVQVQGRRPRICDLFWFSGFAFYTLYYIHLISSIVEMWICRNSLSKDEFWRKESTTVNSLTYVNFEFSHHFFYALNLINLPLFAYFVSITYILLNNKQIENSIVFAH